MRLGLPLYVSPDFTQILQYAMNSAPQCAINSRPAEFSAVAGALLLASSPDRALHSAMAELPLIRRSLIEHEALIAEAEVPELLRRTGWIKLFRSDANAGKRGGRFRARQEICVEGEILDRAGVRGGASPI